MFWTYLAYRNTLQIKLNWLWFVLDFWSYNWFQGIIEIETHAHSSKKFTAEQKKNFFFVLQNFLLWDVISDEIDNMDVLSFSPGGGLGKKIIFEIYMFWVICIKSHLVCSFFIFNLTYHIFHTNRCRKKCKKNFV
jgi:hypothetical protein